MHLIIPVHLTVPDVLSSGYLKWTKNQSNNRRSGKQANCGTVGGLVGGGREPGRKKTIELRKKRTALFIINERGLLFSF